VPVSVSGSDQRAAACVGGSRERERDATRDPRSVPWGFYDRINIKRDALALVRGSRTEAGDIAGLQVSFDRTLAGLFMAYQPIVRAADGTVFGYEALMRSSDPALPHPEAILDAAERLGRVIDLGRIVRARTARCMAETGTRPVFFVNLLPADLLDDELLLQDLSPVGSRGTSFTGITGYQEPTWWRGDIALRGPVARGVA
jgi:hypothetical protein